MATRTGYAGTESSHDTLTPANFNKLPNGLVAYATTSTATTAISGTGGKDLTGLSLTFTFASSRIYKIEGRVRFGNPSASTHAYAAVRTSGGTVWGTVVEYFFTGPGADYIVQTGSFLYAPGAGSQTIKITGYTTDANSVATSPGGAIPDATGPDYLAVYDMGPSF